jgi:hypothetical protein
MSVFSVIAVVGSGALPRWRAQAQAQRLGDPVQCATARVFCAPVAARLGLIILLANAPDCGGRP